MNPVTEVVGFFANPTVLLILTIVSWVLIKTIFVQYWVEWFERWFTR